MGILIVVCGGVWTFEKIMMHRESMVMTPSLSNSVTTFMSTTEYETLNFSAARLLLEVRDSDQSPVREVCWRKGLGDFEQLLHKVP